MSNDRPKSLGDYEVPPEREAIIKAHIATLSETARAVSDKLAFGTDVSDVAGVLEAHVDEIGNTAGGGER